MEVKAKARKWGSSIGIILPKTIVAENGIRENDEVVIDIRRKSIAGKLFGKFPTWKKSTQELKNEMREGWK